MIDPRLLALLAGAPAPTATLAVTPSRSSPGRRVRWPAGRSIQPGRFAAPTFALFALSVDAAHLIVGGGIAGAVAVPLLCGAAPRQTD